MNSIRQTIPSNRKSILFVALAIVLVTAPVSASVGFKRVSQPNPRDPMAVQIYQLENGLTVYLTENHETPRFEAQIAVRAGSKQDPAESTGLAHPRLREGEAAPRPHYRALRKTFPRDRSRETQSHLRRDQPGIAKGRAVRDSQRDGQAL